MRSVPKQSLTYENFRSSILKGKVKDAEFKTKLLEKYNKLYLWLKQLSLI